jgi:hypothetical protein
MSNVGLPVIDDALVVLTIEDGHARWDVRLKGSNIGCVTVDPLRPANRIAMNAKSEVLIVGAGPEPLRWKGFKILRGVGYPPPKKLKPLPARKACVGSRILSLVC